MQIFASTAMQMGILFLIIGAGVLARRLHIMNDEFDRLLSRLVLDFSMPALIIGSVLNSQSLPGAVTIELILLYSVAAYAIVAVIAYVVPLLFRKLGRNQRGAHSFVIMFGNVGFIGFPVISTVFGPHAVLYAAIFNIAYNLGVFTVGIAMLSQGAGQAGDAPVAAAKLGIRGSLRRLWRNIANPCMAACVVAPVLAVCGITDNGGFAGQACSMLGQLTVPASMMIIGSSLAKMSVRDMLAHIEPYVTSVMRLLVVPIVMLLVFRLFVTDQLILGVLVLEMGMPAASLGAMLSLLYGGDIDTIMRCTFITTVLSLVAIPFVAMLVM